MANPNASLPRQCSLSSLQIKGSEAQRIADDRHGRQAHRQRRDHRTQQQASHRIKHPRRNGYAQRVITKGEEQVLPDIARHATREATRADEAHEVPLHQRSEEHTSELQPLMRLSYTVFCLKKKNSTTI